MPTKLSDLNITVQKSIRPILKNLSHFSNVNNIPKSVYYSNLNKIYKRISDSKNQSKEAQNIIKSIKEHLDTAQTFNELIPNIRKSRTFVPKIPTQVLEETDAESKIYTEPKKQKRKSKSKGKETVSESHALANAMQKLTIEESPELYTKSEQMMDELFDQYHNPNTSQMDVDEMKQAIEPTQMEHINKISELLKREPKLKNEIKNIIVNQFVKAKIKPEQYEAIKQNIDALEVPEASHKAVKAKPRGKQSKLNKPVDEVIEQIIVENKPKPKGKKSKLLTKNQMNVDAPPIINEKQIKPVKETYKQKKKVIRMD